MLLHLSDVGATLKINLASFGNMVPHLHWHLIARFEGDPHFPLPIWSQPPQGEALKEKQLAFQNAVLPRIVAKLSAIDADIKNKVKTYLHLTE